MEQYRIGQPVRLAEGHPGISRRLEVVRPDGSPMAVDWDKRVITLRPGLPGLWRWRLYFREQSGARIESGAFEVTEDGDLSTLTAFMLWLARVRGRS